MFQRQWKAFGALVALLALMGLPLHAMGHVFGWDHDADEGPCPTCQALLAQHAVQAVATVRAPAVPLALAAPPADAVAPSSPLRTIALDSRGPPADLA
jgi:hypothetical protein